MVESEALVSQDLGTQRYARWGQPVLEQNIHGGSQVCVHAGAACGWEVLPSPDREPVWHEGARSGAGNGYQGPDDDSGGTLH